MKARWWQGSLLYLLILVALLALAFSFFPVNKGPKEVDYFTFVDNAKTKQIDAIQQDGTTIIGLKDDKPVVKAAFVGSTKELLDSFKDAGIQLGDTGIKFEVKTGGIDWGSIMLTFLPLLLLAPSYSLYSVLHEEPIRRPLISAKAAHVWPRATNQQ